MFRSASSKLAANALSKKSSFAVGGCVQRQSLHYLSKAAGASSVISGREKMFPSTFPFNVTENNNNNNNINNNSNINKTSRRSVFIQTETTPNPESLKFVPANTQVIDSPDGNGYYVTSTSPKEEILRSPLAKELFRIDGVKSVYLGADFVTITKFAQNDWPLMRPHVFGALMDFFDTNNKPALLDTPEIADTTILDDDDEVVAMIKELMEARIRPAVQEDGGDIRYVGFDEESGIVTVQLAGSCVGCPSSSVTLKQGVENMLMHYIPEITGVEALEEEEEEEEEGESEAGDGNNDEAVGNVQIEKEVAKEKSYKEKLAAAGIPFSD